MQRSKGRGQRYSGTAIALHWGIAVLVVFNLVTGLFRPILPRNILAYHESAGILVLILSIVRIAWWVLHRRPPLLRLQSWERGLARAVHLSFYAVMLVSPLSGWAIVSATPPLGTAGAAWYLAHLPAPVGPAATVPRPHITYIFGGVPLPAIAPIHQMGRLPSGVAAQRKVHEQVRRVHVLFGYAAVLLLLFHLGGVLKHELIDGRRGMRRMIPLEW